MSLRVIESLCRDLRLAVRAMSAAPIVTSFAVLSLALTIGANTAIFTILNGLLFRTLPVHEPTQLVHVTDSVVTDEGLTRIRAWSYPFWEQLRQRPHVFESATAWSFTQFNLASGGETRFVRGMWADGGFFETLGVSAVLGRTFSGVDDQHGGGPDGLVAVISYAYWQRELGGAADAIGRSVRLNSVPFTIVGVAPPSFFGTEVGRTFDFIVPLSSEALIRGGDSALESASTNFLSVMGRLKPGQSVAAAAIALRDLQPAIRQATLGRWSQDVVDRYLTSPFTALPAATGYSSLRRAYQRPVLIIAAIVALVLLVGCVNVANLQLARAIARRHELSVQVSLGASRWRVARQLLMESLLLSATGAAVGLVIAAYASRLLVRQLSTPANPIFLDVSIDGSVLAFTAGVTVITTILFGTLPALRATRVPPIDALQERGRSLVDHARGGLGDSLVVMQVALSLTLVVAAGLFIRSFASLTGRELGFEADQVLVVTIDPERTGLDAAQRVGLYERVRSAVLALPNVANAALSHRTPAGGGGFTPAVEIVAADTRRVPELRAADGDVFGNLISPGWFDTFGIRLLAGRDFAASDRSGAARVAVVNETFARKFLGDSPLGSTVTVYPNTPRALSAQIVGVVGDAVYGSPRDLAPPMWYLPISQFTVPGFPFSPVRLSVRAASGSPALLTRSVAAAATAVNPSLALTFRPLAAQVHGSLIQQRLMAQVAGFFGAVALLLAGLGLYGVASYAVSRRRREIGMRMALGATPAGVTRLVLTRISLQTLVGIVVGTGISLWASQFIKGLIYGLPDRDPVTLLAAVIVLFIVGGLAGWLPARRAARIDPVAALREG